MSVYEVIVSSRSEEEQGGKGEKRNEKQTMKMMTMTMRRTIKSQ